MTAALCVFLPLLGAAVAGLFGRAIGRRGACVVTCAAMAVSALCGALVFAQAIGGREPYTVELLRWMRSGTLDFSWALYVDSLTALMMFAVSAVSALVHVYSVGYMARDAHVPRFMAYLSLFTFAMLMLVTADNFVQLYFGWEGVGLCSYLLIGFWFTRPAANAAAIKAFVVNRVGDFGFALGIFAIYLVFDSVDYSAVFGSAAAHAGDTFSFLGFEGHALTLICLLLFVGAMGKSAQLFLHTWLPDAMEGPTPSRRSSTPQPWSPPGCSWLRAVRPCSSTPRRRWRWSPSSAPPPLSSPRPSRSRRTTSSASSHIRPVASSATCSSPAAFPLTPPGYSIF